MNYKKIWASLVVASILLLASCNAITDMVSPKTLDTVEGVQECINYLQEHFGDKTVILASFSEGKKLTSKVGKIYVIYLNADAKKTSVLMVRKQGEWIKLSHDDDDKIDLDADYKCVDFKGVDLKSLNAETIVSQFKEAIGYTPEEYTYRSIGSYTIAEPFTRNKKNMTISPVGETKRWFELHVTEQGRRGVYMDMKFAVEPDESLSAIE